MRLHILHHAAQGELYGQWMMEELARHGYHMSPGRLYPLLHAMEEKGYLESRREGEGQNPKALEHMRRVGHFEFGLDRRPVHLGDDAALQSVTAAWAEGQEVLGWAHHWRALHAFLLDRIEASPALRRAVLIVRFEDLCRDPHAALRRVLGHCALEAGDAWIDAQAADFHLPAYYRPNFSDGELETIRRITGPTAARLGYAERDLAVLPAE